MFSRFFNSEFQIPLTRRERVQSSAPSTVEAHLREIQKFYSGLVVTDQMLSAKEFVRVLHDLAFLAKLADNQLFRIKELEHNLAALAAGPAPQEAKK